MTDAALGTWKAVGYRQFCDGKWKVVFVTEHGLTTYIPKDGNPPNPAHVDVVRTAAAKIAANLGLDFAGLIEGTP